MTEGAIVIAWDMADRFAADAGIIVAARAGCCGLAMVKTGISPVAGAVTIFTTTVAGDVVARFSRSL